jgi:thiamine biosynthesis lipoprotein
MQYLFGTLCAIEVEGPATAVLSEAVEAAFAELGRIQRLLSPYDPSSELSRVNASAGAGPHHVSQELCEVLCAALAVSERTSGRYDVTMWPILTLWRSCEDAQRWPTADELRAAVSCVDYRAVEVDREARTVTLRDSKTQLDLSSAAKGFALDRALDVVRRGPVTAALLNAGGQLMSSSNAAVATSGQDEPHLIIEGRTVGHVFDTRSGWPIDTAGERVSVVAPTGLEADLLSTALLIIGADEDPSLLQHYGSAICYRHS